MPDPFTAADHAAGFNPKLSILQAEFSRTQVFDRPLSGRHLFEEIISKIKQHFKEGRALRTETTLDNTHDCGVGGSLINLPALRAIGFNANRRLLEVETLSQDCTLAEGVYARVTQPQVLAGQRASGLRFDDARVAALLQVLCLFLGLPEGFRNASLRDWMAQALAIPVDAYSPGRLPYDLRRLRLHGLIARIPHSHRYQVTDLGIRVALFFTKVHSRILRPGLSQRFDGCPNATNRPVATAMRRLDQTLAALLAQAKPEPCKI